MKTLLVLGIFIACASPPAWAITHFLKSDLGVKGALRHCSYSNGRTLRVNSAETCPPSVEDSATGMGHGVGTLQGEHRDGGNKVCVYQVFGERRGMRVSATQICPLNAKF